MTSSYARPASIAPLLPAGARRRLTTICKPEERGHGPRTKHLASALLPVEISVVWKGVKAAEEAMEGRRRVSVGTAAGRKLIVKDLERRIKDGLK
jgi:transcriptional adapter 3